jgi:hypothetical protein
MPKFNFAKYRVPEATLSKDQSTLTTTFAAFNSDPKALELFIREQAALPPKPQVRVTGTHTEMGQTKVDFDVRLNMIRYLLHPQEKWNFIKISPPEKKLSKDSKEENDGLSDWAKKFCKDIAMIKR